MAKEKFKTAIGGQALLEGILMRGPDKDAIVVNTPDGLNIDVKPRKIRPKNSIANWPLIRGACNFFDAQVTGVKALMQSADLSPEIAEEEPSKLDLWLEKKLGNEKFQQLVIGFAVFMGLALSIALFILLPSVIGDLIERWMPSIFVRYLVEGVIRLLIFFLYLFIVSRMKEMQRVFAYHGAEHKTIRCYEAGLPLTVENVREQTRMHPRCGTSFLLIIMIISIFVFFGGSQLLLKLIPALQALQGGFLFRLIMIAFKLLLLPLIVGIGYEINRWVGRNDNWLTRILMAPGLWFQNFTTYEPDDDMIRVGIAALEAVIPEEAGADQW